MLSMKQINVCTKVEDKIDLGDRILHVTSWTQSYKMEDGDSVHTEIEGFMKPKENIDIGKLALESYLQTR